METKQHSKDKDSRIYDTPYGSVPSVTTCLGLKDKSGALMGWAVKMMAEYLKTLADSKGTITIKKEEADEIFKKAKARHKEIKTQSAELGSAVHNLIEVYLKNQPVDGLLEADKRLIKPFEAFKLWQSEHKFELVESERQVCSHLKYAGTLDCICKLDDKMTLLDIKSSNAIYDEMFWQISAYKECAEHGKAYNGTEWVDCNYDIERLGILRLGKEDGLPEWKEITLLEAKECQDAFMCLCSLWHIINRNKKEKS